MKKQQPSKPQQTFDSHDAPLAVRMRPRSLEEFAGQKHLLGEGKMLRRALDADRLSCLILWGPPGTGKTTLGEIVSQRTGAEFIYMNASFTVVKDIKTEISAAHERLASGKRTILFIDEIHRLNRTQQDVLIPDTESQFITLMGATTYNPFFYLNPALISRSLVCEFKPLGPADIVPLLKRALSDKERGLGGYPVEVTDDVLNDIAERSNGDARKALNSMEIAVRTTSEAEDGRIRITLGVVKETVQTKPAFYDRQGDYHYDTISAFIKSVRGSDPDAAVYWLGVMLQGGEDPRFIARRLVILASEDIGNADPYGLTLAMNCFHAVECVGMPEARIILAQVTTYLALAPKSNAAYMAIDAVLSDLENMSKEEVPSHLKDAHYKGAAAVGHGDGYLYPHDHGGHVKQAYRASGKRYYYPKESGREKAFKDKLEQLLKKTGKTRTESEA